MKRNTRTKKLDGNPPPKQAKVAELVVVNVNKRKSTLRLTQNSNQKDIQRTPAVCQVSEALPRG